jgi:DNA-binding NtrC family response regulator
MSEALRVLYCDDSGGALDGFRKEVAAELGDLVEAQTAASLDGFRELVRRGESFDVVVSDLDFERVGGGPKDGLLLLAEARRAFPDAELLLLTAYAGSLTFEEGLELAQAGLKPASVFKKTDAEAPGSVWLRLRERLQGIAQARGRRDSQLHALEAERWFHKARGLEEAIARAAELTIPEAARLVRADPTRCLHEMVGQSFGLRDVIAVLERAARRQSDVLILGETGTGKELVARALHACGPRKERPLVKTDLASANRELVASELFGHERGAFTGALKSRRGLLAEADGGTIFFDEIGNLTAEVQAGLLRVLQDRTFRTVGGERDQKVDVVVLAATNVDLEESARQGRFRPDLLERLSVVRLELPPLRERREDIPLLAVALLDELRTRFKVGGFTRITAEALGKLAREPWPRNVRQLRNALERLFSLLDEATDPITAEAIAKVLPRDAPPAAAEKPLWRRVLDGEEGRTLAEIAHQYGDEAVREVIEKTFLELHGPPDEEQCARLFHGMKPNSWRQFAFKRGLTFQRVRRGETAGG